MTRERKSKSSRSYLRARQYGLSPHQEEDRNLDLRREVFMAGRQVGERYEWEKLPPWSRLPRTHKKGMCIEK